MTTLATDRRDTALDVQQAGAICWRHNKKERLEVLLVGSKRNGRWGVPKGHVDPGETSDTAAAREAFEEAGVSGSVERTVFGSFEYRKEGSLNTYRVTVHLLQVTELADTYPEKAIRKSRWFPIKSAARNASQPGLRTLLRQLG
ncbi:NUDIX hydrolase (plasmid) [Rhizobium sp. CC1099]|uniref:NUDIX hydrolase n=1 Tax=Rhizobium sp. CC1099 TaxID=3039160 RepID=UPI0024B25BA4|nr:NUDIX hydrolase [Rhizobium sp. CC1099]WFU92170.1 NUDIX hydrolase [Rhizobium sp. CC1099]